MTDYKAMYLVMFQAVGQVRQLLTEEAFSRENVHKAALILGLAQLQCEEIYMEGSGD